MGDPIKEQIQQTIDELLVVYKDMGKLTDAYTKQLKKKKKENVTGPELVKDSQILAALSVIQDNEDHMSVKELEQDVFNEEGIWTNGIGDAVCSFIREVLHQPCKDGERVQAVLEQYNIC
jgi:hypothetical protein